MGEKNCHVCQQKENKSQKLYCVFLFIYICLIVAPEMVSFRRVKSPQFFEFFSRLKASIRGAKVETFAPRIDIFLLSALLASM